MPKLKCVTAILGLTLCCAAKLGAQAVEGAGYDPVAVRLDQNATTTSRPVAPMDLLTLRDPKGVSISPDGSHVAFAVGQAEYETNRLSFRSFCYRNKGWQPR